MKYLIGPTRRTRRVTFALLFEPRDVWIGVYWNRKWVGVHRMIEFYVCIVPLFPIHLTVIRKRPKNDDVPF